jgi:hypothetical protein
MSISITFLPLALLLAASLSLAQGTFLEKTNRIDCRHQARLISPARKHRKH